MNRIVRTIFVPIIAIMMLATGLFCKQSDAIELPYGSFIHMCGDANLDAEITSADISVILQHCAGNITLSAMQIINSDTNSDNKINTSDALVLLKFVVGTIKYLPYTGDVLPENSTIRFYNNSFPQNGERLSFNKSYELNATIKTEKPLTGVRVVIYDKRDNSVEIDKSVQITEKTYTYNTCTSDNAIDDYIKFATLTTGEKRLCLYCSTSKETNTLIYESNFRVGYVYSEIAGHVFDKKDEPSSSEARKILALLNSLDYNHDKGAKIIEAGIENLGQDYTTMDCSRFVQITMKKALNFDLPRISSSQAEYCAENGLQIPIEEMRAGDALFMSRTYCDCGRYHEVHHSAIYLGYYGGTDYIIESTSSLGGVVIRRIWGLVAGRWVVDSAARLY